MTDPTPLPAGSDAPDFSLTDVLSGETIRLSALHGQPVILNFWSLECPWSRKFDDYFLQRAAEWAEQGISLLFVDSNDNEAVYDIQDTAEELGVTTPVLRDKQNVVADAYGALTTPHLFVINAHGQIAYQGAVDDQTFRQQEATTHYLDAAVAALLRGETPPISDAPAYGCAIVRHYD